MSRTKYHVFRQSSTNGAWEEFMTGVEATSSKAAIRLALSGVADDGMYVAVPKRSWQPQPVEVETQQRLKIG